MNIVQVPLENAIPLIAQCGLPVADLSVDSPPLMFSITINEDLAGVVGIELYGPVALLRSLAIAPELRKQGLASKLVAHAESFARKEGMEEIFLLTNSAEAFFEKRGYAKASRDTAPPAIQASRQFCGLCPASASFMSRTLV